MLNQGKIVRCSWEKFQSISHDPDILYVIKDKGQIWMGDKCIADTPKDIWSLGIVDTEVGKTVKITEVDDSGKPTAWEAVEFPEQVQSDWSQNDETAVDYIKNRPFYSNRTEALNLSLEDFTFHDDGTGMGYYTYECSEPIHVDFNLDNIDYYISGTTNSGEAFACNKTVNASIDEEYSQFSDNTNYYSLSIYIDSNNNLSSIDLYEYNMIQFQGALTFILDTGVIKQIPVEYIPVLQGPSENDKLPISAFYAESLIEGKASELIGTASSELRRELMDYVLDERPCYAEYTKTDVIALQTKNFSYLSNKDVYYGSCNDKNYLTNTACKVLWDDVIYDVVSSDDSGYPCYGDKNLVEYPFYFVLSVSESYGPTGYDIYTNSTAASHTFRVYTETLSKVKQLDIACIPDEVKSLGITGAAAGDILRVKAVDDNGKPTEWETISTTDLVNEVLAALPAAGGN